MKSYEKLYGTGIISEVEHWHTHIFEAGLLYHVAVPLDRLKLVSSLGNIVFELLAVLLRKEQMVFF